MCSCGLFLSSLFVTFLVGLDLCAGPCDYPYVIRPELESSSQSWLWVPGALEEESGLTRPYLYSSMRRDGGAEGAKTLLPGVWLIAGL